jgi:Ca2+/Na+ antiporter
LPAAVRQTPAATMLGVAIGMFAFGLLGALLFSFVTFMNSWSTYQRLQGQAYHAASFQVTRVYLQRGTSKNSSTRVFASGMVEGRKEWMDLLPYLKRTPSDQAELESLVPEGTVISVYLFPDLKGYARIQVVGAVPPAEANYKRAMSTLNYGLVALGIGVAVLFALNRMRRSSAETATV